MTIMTMWTIVHYMRGDTLMTGAYYIHHSPTIGGTWYMLCVRETHFCISCGSDLERTLDNLKKSVKRHRRPERLMKALSGLECGGKVSPATFEQREEWYRLHGEDYKDLVHSTVLEALQEAREEDKANSPLRKTTNRKKKVGWIQAAAETIEEHTQVDSTPAKDSPKILRKPRVFNRK